MLSEVVEDFFVFFNLILIIFCFFMNIAESISNIKASRAFYKLVNDFENTSLDDIVKAYMYLYK